MASKNFMIVLVAFVLIAAVLISDNSEKISGYSESEIPKFASCTELKKTFDEARLKGGRGFGIEADILTAGATTDVTTDSTTAQSESSSTPGSVSPDFSGTNVQVEGVDEADFLKTDGKFIYQLSQGSMAISQAYPAEKAELFSLTKLDEDFNPQEMLVHGNTLILFGQTFQRILYPEPIPTPVIGLPEVSESIAPGEYYPPYYRKNFTTIQLWDVSNKGNPELKRTIDFEGQYRESRKIGSDVYFVITSYPHYAIFESETADDALVPVVRDSKENEDFEKIGECGTIGYLPPVRAESFITVASLDLDSFDSEIEKETVVGSGQNVYASTNNLYFAETTYDYVIAEPLDKRMGILPIRNTVQQTHIHKFSLDNGKIDYQGNGEAPGRILNQFSMDEFENNFRIATTTDNALINGNRTTSNNVYVLDSELNLIGSLEELAPGEQIFSARFMGSKLYMVTFQKIDPLFVIDLSEPKNPKVLGKLKIPGFSDYLHPFDDKHIIGVGKEAIEAEQGNFAWYQGLKLALFDVSDVENPVQLHQQIIGDRGTESYALNDHKAFLFDRERELLVLPVTLAEIKNKDTAKTNTFGEFVFQGSYVFNLTTENGFELRDRITHNEDDEIFTKSGHYFFGNNFSIKRALYIDDILYTVSDGKILGNSLNDLEELVKINIPVKETPVYYGFE